MKTRDAVNAIKHRAPRAVISNLSSDASLARSIQRAKKAINMATVDVKKVKKMVIPLAATRTHPYAGEEEGEPFLIYNSKMDGDHDKPWIIAFMSPFGEQILQRAEVCATDALYTKSPLKFYQYLMVHALLDGRWFPVAFVWMNSKQKESYERALGKVFRLPNCEYNIKYIMGGEIGR